MVPAIEDDTGTLVPDRRDPVFHVPSWVTLPDFLGPHLAARNATSTDEVPYRIEKVIHFSNGGGLYVGRDVRTDTQLVLKEARPHAGLDADGADAVARLAREADALRRLADLPQVPRVHDEFALGEHRFLALEFIEGRPLNKVLVDRYPLIDADATDADRAAYTRWALDVHRQVEEVVTAIHDRGLVYGDLHLFNVMVRPDDRIALVDFEVAAPIDGHRRPGLRNQGFAAPRDRTGPAVDRYALACLRLALFLPLTQLVRLGPDKAAHLADVIAAHFPVPRDLLDDAVREITGPAPADAGGAPDLTVDVGPAHRDRLARAILASATPDRDDRLFPGDIEQFRSGGLNLAHGAAGVLYALHVSGAGRWPEHEKWLVRHATAPPPAPGAASTTACTASRTPSMRSAAGRTPSTCSTSACASRWTAWTTASRAASPASRSTWPSWPDAPARRPCATRPGGLPSGWSTSSPTTRGRTSAAGATRTPGCCAAAPGRRCCWCGCTS